MTAALPESVRVLLHHAFDVYADRPHAADWLRWQAERLDGPLRIAVLGQQKTGKSTLVNALVGEQVAPLEPPGAQPVPVWYLAGATPAVTAFEPHGPPHELPAERVGGQLRVDFGELRGRTVDRVVVDWPSRGLRGLALIDLPASSTVDSLTEADAVLYLTQHLPAADLRLLRSLHEHPVAWANPVGTLLVQCRADEIGGSQIDALFAARQLARQRRREPRTRELCQDVVAVSALLGYAGRTLRHNEFDALVTIAFAPRAEVDGHLLSADRFAGNDFPVAVPAELRRALLDRLGLFGSRLATALIRQGCTTHTELCAQLVRRSGLTELREAIGRHLTDRADVLKARSVLIALDAMLRTEPRPAALALAAELERVLAAAHDLRELRLLALLHAGQPILPGELDGEARRLLGGDGVSAAARLGLASETVASETVAGEVRKAAAGALRRWRAHAENPVLDEAARDAAAVVVRSCEGLLVTAPAH